ncbi:MAG: phosphoserine phosphatase SerB, partial [Gammaproteobacteria bacterium]
AREVLAGVVDGEALRIGASACRLDFECTPAAAWSLLERLRAGLHEADVYLQPRDELGKRLLICDMDMTIVAAETLDEVAAKLGLGDEIAAITERAMNGELDFDAALRERIAMLAGRPEQVFRDIVGELELNPGAEALLAGAKAAGVHTILVSGGFEQVAGPVAQRLGFDELHCNRLEIEGGKLTGRVPEPIVNADRKCSLLQQRARAHGLDLKQCCAIGDGANDLPMVSAAGLGIAYRGKPVLRDAAACRIDHTGLDSALHFMGLPN